MVRGVSDYVDKNRLNRLPMVVQRALEHHRINREREQTALELVASKQRLAELTEHLQESIDRERADIAREIHDDIGGSLAAIRLDLAWLGRGRRTARTHMFLEQLFWAGAWLLVPIAGLWLAGFAAVAMLALAAAVFGLSATWAQAQSLKDAGLPV